VSLASQSALTASALLCDESPLAIAVTQMAKSLPYQIPASRRLGMQLNLPNNPNLSHGLKERLGP